MVLLAQHVLGRDRTCSTVLTDAEASRLHASILWTGHRWELRDISRNGTLVDGQRVPTNVAIVLGLGQRLSFGPDATSQWEVQDIAPPGPLLLPMDAGAPMALCRSNLLPSAEEATVSIVREAHGQWQCTTEQGSRLLQEGDELTFGGRRWRFFAAAADNDQVTLEPPPGQSAPSTPCHLRFSVSLDEEHVHLDMTYANRALSMGERSHHYLLLTLARIRAESARKGLAVRDQGWVSHDRLGKMLGLDGSHVNIQIFRLRQQVIQALGRDQVPPPLIERRRGELRLGDCVIEIRQGSFAPSLAGFAPADTTRQAWAGGVDRH